MRRRAPSSARLGYATWLLLVCAAQTIRACTLAWTRPTYQAHLGIRIPVCTGLKGSEAPIRVPNDTATSKYGSLQFAPMGLPVIGGLVPGQGDSDGYQVTFFDRDGEEYPVLPSALPVNATALAILADYSPLLIVRATIYNETVASFRLAMYVPYSTVLGAFRDTTFIGNISTLNGPKGIPEFHWVRWDFASRVITSDPTDRMATRLPGVFTNLYSAIRDGTTCQEALCSTQPLCDYYTEYFGNSTNMTLYWNPSMHAPGDTELVPEFASSIDYMARFVLLHELLKPHSFYKEYRFSIHGNPVGTPFSFSGVLAKRTAWPVVCQPVK